MARQYSEDTSMDWNEPPNPSGPSASYPNEKRRHYSLDSFGRIGDSSHFRLSGSSIISFHNTESSGSSRENSYTHSPTPYLPRLLPESRSSSYHSPGFGDSYTHPSTPSLAQGSYRATSSSVNSIDYAIIRAHNHERTLNLLKSKGPSWSPASSIPEYPHVQPTFEVQPENDNLPSLSIATGLPVEYHLVQSPVENLPQEETVPQESWFEPPLPKDPSGYVDIFAAYERLLQRPVLNTDHIDYLFFPCDQWARILAGGSRQCRVAARMTYSGSPVWENIGKPCEHVLKTGDSYRRHILLCHLGVRREDGHTQNDWISKRWNEAAKYQ